VSLTIKLIRSLQLPDFPSGSSINFHCDKLYVIGDDATHVLVLDSDHRPSNFIRLVEGTEKRIPKTDKLDLEGSTIVTVDGSDTLLIVGSASHRNRDCIVTVGLQGQFPQSLKSPVFCTTATFITRLTREGITEVNIEAVTLIGSKLLLGNRGNATNPQNHLIVTTENFWTHQETADLHIIKLRVPEGKGGHLGLSELCYLSANDLLFLTLSSENTPNAFDDGEIGDSYLAAIRDISTKLDAKEVMIDDLINLSDADPTFKGHKIEGICVETTGDGSAFLHLVSDNDMGESTLFKTQISLQHLNRS
jgi:hypothetical protein